MIAIIRDESDNKGVSEMGERARKKRTEKVKMRKVTERSWRREGGRVVGRTRMCGKEEGETEADGLGWAGVVRRGRAMEYRVRKGLSGRGRRIGSRLWVWFPQLSLAHGSPQRFQFAARLGTSQ